VEAAEGRIVNSSTDQQFRNALRQAMQQDPGSTTREGTNARDRRIITTAVRDLVSQPGWYVDDDSPRLAVSFDGSVEDLPGPRGYSWGAAGWILREIRSEAAR
jgi:hypothetical protein